MTRTKLRCSQCGAPNDGSRDRCRICGGPLRDPRTVKPKQEDGKPSFKEIAENEVTAWGEYEDRAEAIRARHQGIDKLPGPSWVTVLVVLLIGAALVVAAFNTLVV